MTERGLIPVITLNHWVLTPPSEFTKKIGQGILPSLLRDLPLADPPESDPYWKSLRGWENKETVKEFVKYVAKVAEELRDQVEYWVTISEPVAPVIGAGYIAGLWPPGFFLMELEQKKYYTILLKLTFRHETKLVHLIILMLMEMVFRSWFFTCNGMLLVQRDLANCCQVTNLSVQVYAKFLHYYSSIETRYGWRWTTTHKPISTLL